MKLLFDACSIILLAKASVLEKTTEKFKLETTEEVCNEVMKGKTKMFQDALLFERLHSEKKFSIINVDLGLKNKIKKDFNMGAGEASIIAEGIQNKQIIVTDNRQGRKAAQINDLQLVGSIEIIVNLYQKKSINKDKANGALNILKKEGWFEPYLIDKAKEDIK